jgi:hypothetical protein
MIIAILRRHAPRRIERGFMRIVATVMRLNPR